jgi:hypothetical protein
VSEDGNIGIIDEPKKLELIVGGEINVTINLIIYTVHKINLGSSHQAA